MRVAFVNENTLGHASYLLPFVQVFHDCPEWGITPVRVDAVPLPENLKRWGEGSIRVLRRWGLDFGASRWRRAASLNVRQQLETIHREEPLDAVVVNTQSVGLELHRWKDCPPIFVCLDATFRQLRRTAWFAPGPISRFFGPWTLRTLMKLETELFHRAAVFFPWSSVAKESLLREYGIAEDRIRPIPPSVPLGPRQENRPPNRRPQILFLGGDFHRKGGAILLDAFRQDLHREFDLHIVTQSNLPPEKGVFVHRSLVARSPAWYQRWREADIFVFPSKLETFGIVLLEALSFGVPTISSRAGAAEEILDGERAGLLLKQLTPAAIIEAVHTIIREPQQTQARINHGRNRISDHYELGHNVKRLAATLKCDLEIPLTSEPVFVSNSP